MDSTELFGEHSFHIALVPAAPLALSEHFFFSKSLFFKVCICPSWNQDISAIQAFKVYGKQYCKQIILQYTASQVIIVHFLFHLIIFFLIHNRRNS